MRTPKTQKRRKTIDQSLIEHMTVEEYEDFMISAAADVCSSYKASMSPVCEDLVDNERILGRVSSPMEHSNSWRKNPALLSDEELILENKRLYHMLVGQLRANKRAKEEIEILEGAMKQYDLERQCKYIELFEEETGFLDSSSEEIPDTKEH